MEKVYKAGQKWPTLERRSVENKLVRGKCLTKAGQEWPAKRPLTGSRGARKCEECPHEWGHGSLEGYATFRMTYELPRAGRLGQKKRRKRLVYIGLNFLDVRVNDKGLISFAAA